MATRFRRVGEADVDNRRRISLGKVGRREHTRYIVEENAEGEIRLIPARTIPAREAIVWESPTLLRSLQKGMEQAAAGELESRGSFAEYADEA